MNNFFIFLILLSLCINHTIGGEIKLVLVNELHNKVLAIRCKSKNDNLGDHDLRVGQSKRFEFSDNVWKTTLFWCNMWQAPSYRVHQRFDAYRSKWKRHLDPTYFWIAREDGVYFREDELYGYKPPVKRYDWNHTAPWSERWLILFSCRCMLVLFDEKLHICIYVFVVIVVVQ